MKQIEPELRKYLGKYNSRELSVANHFYELSYKVAAGNAFDWLIERYENQGVILLDDIYELKQRMEEQQ